jgi:hypothetical protein
MGMAIGLKEATMVPCYIKRWCPLLVVACSSAQAAGLLATQVLDSCELCAKEQLSLSLKSPVQYIIEKPHSYFWKNRNRKPPS